MAVSKLSPVPRKNQNLDLVATKSIQYTALNKAGKAVAILPVEDLSSRRELTAQLVAGKQYELLQSHRSKTFPSVREVPYITVPNQSVQFSKVHSPYVETTGSTTCGTMPGSYTQWRLPVPSCLPVSSGVFSGLPLTRIFHDSPAATAHMGILPGVLGSHTMRRTIRGPRSGGCPVAQPPPRSRDGDS
jgi:hypothetical protein